MVQLVVVVVDAVAVAAVGVVVIVVNVAAVAAAGVVVVVDATVEAAPCPWCC
jgi:hypothetical protein